MMWDFGEGDPHQDTSRANYWYRCAAINGRLQDQALMSVNLALGFGVRQDWKDALEWAHRAYDNRGEDFLSPDMSDVVSVVCQHLMHYPWDDDDLCLSASPQICTSPHLC